MATISFKKGDEYALKLSKLGAASIGITKKAIYAGANIVANEIRTELEWVIGNHEMENETESKSTGDLEKSLGISPISADKNGDYNAKIGFDGYDSKGVANQLKARVLESGSSRQKKRPFVRPAVNRSKAIALSEMKNVIDKETEKIFKE